MNSRPVRAALTCAAGLALTAATMAASPAHRPAPVPHARATDGLTASGVHGHVLALHWATDPIGAVDSRCLRTERFSVAPERP